MTDYRNRIKIPVDFGDSTIKFFTKCGTHIAIGYKRIIIGARGPYIEFEGNNIVRKNIQIPKDEMWRTSSDAAFYIEYRTNDACNVKIYLQKKSVNYADYKLDFYYISPFDLKTDNLDVIVTPIVPSSLFDTDKFF